jgi:hypothetical protein
MLQVLVPLQLVSTAQAVLPVVRRYPAKQIEQVVGVARETHPLGTA